MLLAFRLFYSMKRKALHHNSNDEASGNDTEDDKRSAKRTVAAKSGRAPKKSKLIRKSELEADEWISEVNEKRVLCKGCNVWKELHRAYEMKDWEKHKLTCAAITGKVKVRVQSAVIPSVKAVS